MKELSRKSPSKKCDMKDTCTHNERIRLLRQRQKVTSHNNWLDNCNFLPYEIHNICNQQQNRSRQWRLWICTLIKQNRNDHHRCQRYQEAIFLQIIKPRSNWCISLSLSVLHCVVRFVTLSVHNKQTEEMTMPLFMWHCGKKKNSSHWRVISQSSENNHTSFIIFNTNIFTLRALKHCPIRSMGKHLS